MDQCMFSVVFTSYNGGEFIAETLDSIINQKHNYPYEIIICDDCSTDNSREVILSYKEKYPNIIKLVFNEKNLCGPGLNFWNGLTYCSGKYIMSAQEADPWLPDRVKLQIAYMEQYPAIDACFVLVSKYDIRLDGIQSLHSRIDSSQFNKKEIFHVDEIRDVEILSCHTGIKTSYVQFYEVKSGIGNVGMCIPKKILDKLVDDVKPTKRKWIWNEEPIAQWVFIRNNFVVLNFPGFVWRKGHSSLTFNINIHKMIKRFFLLLDMKIFYFNFYYRDKINPIHRLFKSFAFIFAMIAKVFKEKYTELFKNENLVINNP
ncbi:hypothetical protein AGMMS50212_14430 [Spirochaetia bacterium]|nr:hypothetical protein AGMMS50212_14430 [Spirochaetia bacterium]